MEDRNIDSSSPFTSSWTGIFLRWVQCLCQKLLVFGSTVLRRKMSYTTGTEDTNTTSHSYNDASTVETTTTAARHPVLYSGSALAGFLAMLVATSANYMLGPMRDAAALAVGVHHIPTLTLISTVMALFSSVPIGWLFEAPDPERNKRMGRFKLGFLTRGETQGTSLALFYRCFAIFLTFYALGFKILEVKEETNNPTETTIVELTEPTVSFITSALQGLVSYMRRYYKIGYAAFYLVVHLMKLHSISLIWGVTTEAMEYEEMTEAREQRRRIIKEANAGLLNNNSNETDHHSFTNNATTNEHLEPVKFQDEAASIKTLKQQSGEASSKATGKGGKRSRARLASLAFVGFGGTLGGIIGSIIASMTESVLNLSGLLVFAAILLEIAANLSIELGGIMKRHWEASQNASNTSTSDLTSLAADSPDDNNTICDTSMKRTSSFGSMKRISSTNSLNQQMKKAQSLTALSSMSVGNKDDQHHTVTKQNIAAVVDTSNNMNEDSFRARLLRGITTILRSRLLMAIFTYNALYASTSVLLSFQRAELVANRSLVTDNTNNAASSNSRVESSAASDTAFLAKINMASSVAVFLLQASGIGAHIAHHCGQRGTLSLMPMVRLVGVMLLAWWHLTNDGRPPDLILFLALDEFTRVINFAVAKPVREGLWRGLSNEARYEAKPIVDTLANRWGGGSAAFLVSSMNRILRWKGLNENEFSVFGLPPILLLCSSIALWWVMVSAHVGHIRHNIDIELKKHQ